MPKPQPRFAALAILGIWVLGFGMWDFSAVAQTARLTDAEFWRLVTTLSEPSGTFPPQLMSNEDSAQHVVPALMADVKPGGVYLGVGSEQNFTYMAVLEPRLAFIIDIRRDNLLQMLMYRALFELAPDRADFVARLFARERPQNVTAATSASGLFTALDAAPAADSAAGVAAVLDTLTRTRGWRVNEADRAAISRMMETFRAAGPAALKGYGDRTNPTFAVLMAATDRDGVPRGFLASDTAYARVRQLHLENRVIPVVGDFAGEGALRGIARELASRGAFVSVFYVSNVERYLFEQARWRQFHANVTALPLTDDSRFIRSVTKDISVRLDIPIPDGPEKWRTFVVPIREYQRDVAEGRIQSYRDLFQ
jgi:hypothetical protein